MEWGLSVGRAWSFPGMCGSAGLLETAHSSSSAPRLPTSATAAPIQVLEANAVGDEPPLLEEFNDLTLPSSDLMESPAVMQAILHLKVYVCVCGGGGGGGGGGWD